MRTRIGTHLIVGVALVTALVIGLMSVIILRSQRADLISELTRSASQMSEAIKSSLHDDMLANRRDSLHSRIERIGGEEGLEKIRLFNKEGEIMFSSDRAEIGRSVDKGAEACYACHAAGQPLERLDMPNRSRIFTGTGRTRVLGIINPILNEPSCWTSSCHAHDPGQKVLGVLDVTVSLAKADEGVARSRWRMIVLAGLAILASSILLWVLNRYLVVKPVAALVRGTRSVAAGNLRTQIPVTAGQELAELAQSFNEMTKRLDEAQRQLAQADKLASVGRLAAGVAHEINNPLTGVLTYSSLLLKKEEGEPGGGDAERKSDLGVIVHETKRCREIVKGLLDFARQTPPNRRPTDLNEVAKRSVAVVLNQLSLDHIAVSLDLADTLPQVEADPNQLQQVVVNLLVNAADAIGARGGGIKVSTCAIHPWVEVSVEDDGIGVAPEDLPRLFEPFFTTKGTKGTGLGLAVTWGIIQGHRGTIEVASRPGRGTRFTVRLPLAASHPAETSVAAMLPESGR